MSTSVRDGAHKPGDVFGCPLVFKTFVEHKMSRRHKAYNVP